MIPTIAIEKLNKAGQDYFDLLNILKNDYGWNKRTTDIFYFVNTRSVDEKLELIAASPIAIDHIIKMTEEMKRLHEIKWKM